MKRKTNLILINNLLFILLVSCDNENFSKENYQVDNISQREIDLQFLDGRNLYKDSFIDFFLIGSRCISNNDTQIYNLLIYHYEMSRFPQIGIATAQSMAIKNKYGRAYFDVFDLQYAYFDHKNLKEWEQEAIYFLSNAKKNGYFFDSIEFGNKYIKYSEL